MTAHAGLQLSHHKSASYRGIYFLSFAQLHRPGMCLRIEPRNPRREDAGLYKCLKPQLVVLPAWGSQDQAVLGKPDEFRLSFQNLQDGISRSCGGHRALKSGLARTLKGILDLVGDPGSEHQ